VADFFIASIADNDNPKKEIEQYLNSFQEVSGNFIIAHALIDNVKSYFPSKKCKNDIVHGSAQDIVGTLLKGCDQHGLPVLLSVSWDLTGDTPADNRMTEINVIMDELYALYQHHPSFIGFYSYQEGSGTYFAPFIREFCTYTKTINPGLLTACAPYVDDPLLAGYMSIIEPLDIIIFQGMVMASYRPDNRQQYPIRRVKDFCSVGVGAKWQQNKIALTHVECFGYLENKISQDHNTTSYENIYPQILSAATAAGNDGITFFTYSTNIYRGLKNFPELRKSRQAVLDGMNAFNVIQDKISNRSNQLTLYYPYSDWVIERWHNYYLPALDAFRSLGIPVDFLPFAPPPEENHPYYPYHKNEAVFKRLLEEQKILVLPNVSGFHLTDSELIESFVREGGVVIAFGPQIPMGNGYDRKKLFGIEEMDQKVHTSIEVLQSIGIRVKEGFEKSFKSMQLPLWKSSRGKIIAQFEDASPAVVVNHYGKGITVAFALDAETAAQQLPDLARDIIDYAHKESNRSPMVDILGTNENVDVTVARIDDGFRVALVNHNDRSLTIALKPLNIPQDSHFEWIDLITGEKINGSLDEKLLKLNVPALDYLCVEFRQGL
jgi:hypothetical protein